MSSTYINKNKNSDFVNSGKKKEILKINSKKSTVRTADLKSNKSNETNKSQIQIKNQESSKSNDKLKTRTSNSQGKSSNKDLKVMKKLEMITEQINKSKEISNTQNDLLNRIKSLNMTINSYDRNIENTIKTNDSEIFKDKLAINDEILALIMKDISVVGKDIGKIKSISEQNNVLKNRIQLNEVDKEDKSIYYDNKLNSLSLLFQHEVADLNSFLNSLNLESYMNLRVSDKNLDESQISQFFNFLKVSVRQINQMVQEKEKNIELMHSDKQRLLEELNYLKGKYNSSKGFNEKKGQNQGNYDFSLTRSLKFEYNQNLKNEANSLIEKN